MTVEEISVLLLLPRDSFLYFTRHVCRLYFDIAERCSSSSTPPEVISRFS